MKGPPTKLERKEVRHHLGPLKSLLVTPKTLARYKAAVLYFFCFLKANDMPQGRSASEVDLQMSVYIENLWEEGESRSLATDCLSGIQMFLPSLKRNLYGSWRLVTAWQKHELPTRAPPLLPVLYLQWEAKPEKKGSYVLASAYFWRFTACFVLLNYLVSYAETFCFRNHMILQFCNCHTRKASRDQATLSLSPSPMRF